MAISLSTGLKNAMLGAGGGSMADTMANMIIRIFDGSRPATADDSEGAAQILVEITLASGAFTPGVGTNGINLDVAANGIVSKAVAEVWSGVALLSGTATWFRAYDNAVTTGASTTSPRMDGTVSTSTTADMQLPVTAITQSGTTTLDSAQFELP